ncbi:MAG: hypothetical protein WDN24_17360 [Sphingomonas sp.]
MFIFFGAMGSMVIGTVNQRLFGGGDDLWMALALTAAVLMPLAAFVISLGNPPLSRRDRADRGGGGTRARVNAHSYVFADELFLP